MIRATKAIVRLLGYAVGAILVAAVVAVLIVGFTSFGTTLIVNKIASLASTPDRVITISEPAGLLTGKLRAREIRVADTRGVFAEVRGLAIDWSPLALLSGRFRASNISAEVVEVTRAPVTTLPSPPETPADQTESSRFSLPVAIDIERLALPDVRIGKELAGQPFPLAASGKVYADNTAIDLKLNVNRWDVPDARLSADISFAPSQNRLGLNAQLSEPKGGFLAGILHLPGDPAMDIDLSGEGPLSNWSGKLQAALDGQARATLEGRHTMTDKGVHQVQVKGGGDLSSLLPPNFRPLFAGQTNLDLSASFDGTGKIDIQTGNLATGSAVLAASGTLDPAGNNSLNANLLGTSGPVDFRWPLDDGEARFLISGADLQLTGAANAAKLGMSASLESATMPTGTVRRVKITAASDAFDLANRAGLVQVRLVAGETSFTNADIDRAIRGPITLASPLQISRETIGFNGTTLESGRIGGGINGALTLPTDALTGNFRFFFLPEVLPDALAGKFTTTIAVEGQVAGTVPSKINLSNLSLKSGTLETSGSVVLDGETLTANLGGRVLDLSRLVDKLSGQADYTITAQGPLDQLGIAANVRSERIGVAGRTIGALDINLAGTADRAAPQANVRATGTIDGQAIAVNADVTSREGRTQVPALSVDVGKNRLQGRMQLSQTFAPTGALTFDFPDISLLAALGGQEVGGDLKGSVDISSGGGKIGLAVKAAGSRINRDNLTIVKPDINVAVSDLTALAASGTISAGEIAAGANRIAAPSLRFTQNGTQTGFALEANYDDAPLKASGSVETGNGQTLVRLDDLEATPRKIPVRLAAPAQIVISGGTTSFSELTIGTGTGSVTVDGSVGENLNINARIKELPASLASTFLPDLSAQGAISGTIVASGTLDPAGSKDVKANLVGAAGPVEFGWPMEGGEARVLFSGADLQMTGAAAAARMDLSVSLDSATLPQGSLSNIKLAATSDSFDLPGVSGPLQVRLDVGETYFVNPDLNRAVRGPVALAAPLRISKDAIAFNGTTLESGGIKGGVGGSYALASKALDGDFRFSIQPSALPDAAASKFDGPIELQGKIAGTLPSQVNISGLSLKSGTLDMSGNVALNDQTLTAELGGRILNLTRILENTEGQADFSVSAKGPLSALAIDANLKATGAKMVGRTLGSLEMNLTGTADPKAPKGTLRATGTLDGQPINIDADVLSTDGRTNIPALTVDVGANRMQGKLEFSPTFEPTGALTFDFPNIGLLAALGGQKASGDLKGSANVTSNGGRIAIKLNATGSGIRSNELSIARPNINLTIADLKAFSASGNVRADEFAMGANRISGLAVDFTQSGTRTGFNLKAAYDGAPLLASGSVDNRDGQMLVRLDSFSATPRKIPVRLTAPAQITLRAGTATLGTINIATGAGSLTVDGTAGQNLRINARVANLPASLANTFVPNLGAEGVVSGTANVTGRSAAPAVTFKANWAGAATTQTRGAGVAPFSIATDGHFENNRVTINITLTGDRGLSLRGGGSVSLAGKRALDLRFNGNLPFGLAAAQLARQGMVMEGNANVNLAISGTAAAPIINGTITTDGGRVIDVRRNLAINSLAATITFNGQQATISRFSGRLASGGSVSASGTIGIRPEAGFPADISIRLDNATYVDGTLVVATVNGTVAIRGPLVSSPVVSGSLRLERASITIPERLPASLAEINVRHVNAPPAVRAQLRDEQPAQASAKSSSLGLDLKIDAPSHIFVRGRGIDAELGGSVTIRGTAAAPIVSGGFTMRRGRMTILSRRLDFADRSRITFGGDLTPTLDMEATSSSGSTTLIIDVSGLATDPSITFSSSPALPQDEVLAQLIFGQSMSRLSPIQIAQLADAVSQLAGGRSTSLFEGLRSNLGIDDLDVSTDARGQTRVSAGRYINDRTYLELQQGGSSGSKAIINLDVGRGFKLRGAAGANGSGEAGIVYEREY
ncbi:translocation/assembly module TamB domain-containing protein [Rhizobium sp. BK251]|uniref:translocation/assembly module TamB domain-containing protein n=1 Tax=Rhizobium sp. BK251 TaxID=2512125 RepID=UPI001FDEF82E|nr:translocation/assembly module TamB domain-containing protein [Rhizobium sp. BK251]